MSPAATTTERTVKSSAKGDPNVVRITKAGARVRVNWLDTCASGTRSFTAEDLTRILGWVNDLGKRYPELWFDLKDSDDRQFFMRVNKDGKLTANNGLAERGFVSWAMFMRAAKAVIKDVS